jgi:hypothetical protein
MSTWIFLALAGRPRSKAQRKDAYQHAPECLWASVARRLEPDSGDTFVMDEPGSVSGDGYSPYRPGIRA